MSAIGRIQNKNIIMNLDSLNKWLTLSANIGVVLGIVFLAMELRQNNVLMETEARYARTQMRIDANYQLMNNPTVSSAFIKMNTGGELEMEERLALGRYARANFFNVQLAYEDYREGIVSADTISAEVMVNSIQTNEVYRTAWERASADALNPDFVEWIQNNYLNEN